MKNQEEIDILPFFLPSSSPLSLCGSALTADFSSLFFIPASVFVVSLQINSERHCLLLKSSIH